MGWQTGHMHSFRMRHPSYPNDCRQYICFEECPVSYGSSDDGPPMAIQDRKGKLKDYIFDDDKILGIYEYDMGDGWEHHIEFEGVRSATKPIAKYPI